MKSNHFRILALDDERPVLDLYDKILCSIRQVHGSLPSLDNEQLSEPEKSANRRPAASNQHSVSASFDLTLCAQAEEAVEVVRVATENENPFALVFMDIRLLPGPDGLWAAEQIRHLDPNMGIVLVTGYFDTDLEEIERRVPPSDKILYLQKPFYSKEIRQVALSMCTKWQTENELRAVQEGLETTVEKRTSALLEANRRLKVEIEKRVMAEEVSRVLERLGYRVLQAKTGKDAVELAETFDGQIDLALLDIKLPDMTGDKVYPLIMAARPDLKVIVCSGYAIEGPPQDILDAGAEGFVQKPFHIATLAEKLKEVLEGKEVIKSA